MGTQEVINKLNDMQDAIRYAVAAIDDIGLNTFDALAYKKFLFCKRLCSGLKHVFYIAQSGTACTFLVIMYGSRV